MNVYELDFRQHSVHAILASLSAGLVEANRPFEVDDPDELPHFVIDDALQFMNDLWGIAFVSAQVYISGVVSDMNSLRHPSTGKSALTELACPLVSGSTVTSIRLCDATANYFKHHDEWENWDPVHPRRQTILSLAGVGISAADEYPCSRAASLLFGANARDCSALFRLITNWRAQLVADLKRTPPPN